MASSISPECTEFSVSTSFTQTTQLLSVNTPRKRQLKTKVNELEKGVEYLRKLSAKCPISFQKY